MTELLKNVKIWYFRY